MGYRSDVGLCLTTKGKEVLNAALTETEKNNTHIKEIKELLACAEVRSDTDCDSVAYLWRAVKWYLDYDDVGFFENLLNKLDESDYLFIRVGESDDDTDFRGGFWGNPLGMCLTREIAFD